VRGKRQAETFLAGHGNQLLLMLSGEIYQRVRVSGTTHNKTDEELPEGN
jgi:hypothetical protein